MRSARLLFFRAGRKEVTNLKWIDKVDLSVAGGLVVTLRGAPSRYRGGNRHSYGRYSVCKHVEVRMSDALPLPQRPDPTQYRKLAKELKDACQSGDAGAVHAWAVRWIQSSGSP